MKLPEPATLLMILGGLANSKILLLPWMSTPKAPEILWPQLPISRFTPWMRFIPLYMTMHEAFEPWRDRLLNCSLPSLPPAHSMPAGPAPRAVRTEERPEFCWTQLLIDRVAASALMVTNDADPSESQLLIRSLLQAP